MSCCNERTTITAEKAPKAIGPYSVAVRAGHLIYTSGQIGLDPSTGAMVAGGIEAETRQVISNLQVVLEASGTSLERVVKTTVFLKDINDFGRVNEIYGEFFKENPPARSALQVGALPRGAMVEIECVALLSKDAEDCDCQ